MHKLLGILLVIISTSCLSQSGEYKVSREVFNEGISDSTSIVLDVRTSKEFGEARIPRAVNADILSDEFEEQVKDLDRSRPVYVYCRSGRRSNTASIKLTELGFENVYDLEGGILGWTEEGLPADSTEVSTDLKVSH